MGYKTKFQSWTFWSSLGGGVTAIAGLIHGIHTKDEKLIGEAIAGICAFLAIWRTRRGATTEIINQ